MKVALVHDWLTGMRGGEKVLEQLCLMFPEAPIYTLFHFPGTVSNTIENLEIHTSFLQKAPLIKSKYRNYLPLFPSAEKVLTCNRYDLVISSSHCVAKGIIPIFFREPFVLLPHTHAIYMESLLGLFW